MYTTEEIKRKLWNGANELRGSMDASRYKDYMLGLMFYKFLSDKTLEAFRVLNGMEPTSIDNIYDNYINVSKELGDELFDLIKQYLGYYVAPEYLYHTWLKDIDSGDFEVQKVSDSLSNFERTISTGSSSSDFKGLFSSSTLDLTDTALGNNLNARSKNIMSLILLFADLDMIALQKGDVLGDAYEYLIGMFAMESGKKAGEFYTPNQVSEVMAQIVTKTNKITSIYDPAVGSGSLLLTVGNHLSNDAQRNLHYYGQELNTATYNLTRMNLLLHGVRPEKMTIRNDDTLGPDWPEDPERPNEGVQFDAVVMNPPYSFKNWNKHDLKVSDPRFEVGGELPPKSKADYAFLLHGLYHLSPNGTMAIVLPHGVLFRGGSEGTIRKRLLEKNYIDTVIGLPSNLFTNTGIPVVVIILRKNRNLEDPVLFIDSSKNFVKEGKQNMLREKDIAQIVDTYENNLEIEGFSHLATLDEIKENEFNLNIPRYVDSTDKDIPHDVDGHLFGGIPLRNIKDLKVLNEVASETLLNSFEEIREGYVKLTKSGNEILEDIFREHNMMEKASSLDNKIDLYLESYWEKLKEVNEQTDTNELRDSMLMEIKDILSETKNLDTYDGYQIVADIWKDSLKNDVEIISVSSYYNAAKTRVPHMVIKGTGSNRREEQDGWDGLLIPNQLIEDTLFVEEQKNIEKMRNRVSEIESELEEIAEAAKSEDSEENLALIDTLKRDAEDEPTNTFELRLVRSELREASKGSVEYKHLKKVEKLMNERTSMNREIRTSETELSEKVQDSYEFLTNEEIDQLMYKKWFGDLKENIQSLIKQPIQDEIDILNELNERYSETIEDLDTEILSLEQQLEEMMKDMVLTYEG